MELREFVAQTLTQITEGVVDAQKAVHSKGAGVNPAMHNIAKEADGGYSFFGWASGKGSNPVFLVNFDVAVTATEGTQTKGGIGIAVGILGAGSQGQSDKNSSAVSRIQFKVPLILPLQKEKEDA
jgi:hypothetical protein